MGSTGSTAVDRRSANSKALEAFGAKATGDVNQLHRTIRTGKGPSIFTIGYERRDVDGLMSALVDAGVDVLVDIREKPVSRRFEFNRNALAPRCEESGIAYESWPELGSTEHQRETLKESGDFSEFRRRFRDLVRRGRSEDLTRLGRLAKRKTIALLCYERAHEECHRSVVTELMGESFDATIVAIL